MECMNAERLASVAALLVAVLSLAFPLPLPLAAQEEHDAERATGEYETRIDTTIAFDRRGVVDLSLVSGEIVVTGWTRDQVKILASSERGVIRLDATPSRIELSVRARRGRMGDTRYELSVPVGARVLMRSVSGALSVQRVRGEVEAHSVSGDIVITEAASRIEFESVSGSVRGSGLAGDVRGDVISGDLTLTGVTGEIDVESVSGEVAVRGVRSKRVKVETVSGEVDYEGSADPGGRYEFTSHSGDVRLILPENAGAVVSVETFSGEIDSEFPMILQPGERRAGGGEHGRRFEFTFGGGGAQISAETFSGDIIIERGSSRGKREGGDQ